MDIFPAIDLKGGRVVRLVQGDYGQVTAYDLSPLEAAADFAAQGARFLHMVDLDGAKDGRAANYQLVEEVAARTGLFIEIGGGIRDQERIQRYLDAGVGRVILGTAAVRDPDFLQRMVDKYGKQIAVGVDAKDGRVAVSGWLEVTELDSLSFCQDLAARGVGTVIYTDIATDGMLAGTNRDIYPQLTAIKGLDIVASGGVTTPDDVRALAASGCAACIIGKALYAGRLTLAEALAAAAEVPAHRA